MAIAPLPLSPAAAAAAYQATSASAGGVNTDFGSALTQALEGVVQTGQQADAQATAAITGHGNLTDVVTAVSKAELALQTTVAIRDRVVQAYQDIMKMPI
jgi:flagellar hook-basal body complex protein FliE